MCRLNSSNSDNIMAYWCRQLQNPKPHCFQFPNHVSKKDEREKMYTYLNRGQIEHSGNHHKLLEYFNLRIRNPCFASGRSSLSRLVEHLMCKVFIYPILLHQVNGRGRERDETLRTTLPKRTPAVDTLMQRKRVH
ncbi:hypothetical protein Ancab_015148 [Ancistrocladus abbreviatus]